MTWRRIRAKGEVQPVLLISSESDLESLIFSEFDLDEFVLVAAVSPSDANDDGLESLAVSRPS